MSIVLAIMLLGLLCAGAMALAWRVVIITGNSGWTDAFWSFTVGAAGVLAALGPLEGGAVTPRNWLVALLVAIWSARLGLHIAKRTLRGKDDPRYAELKRGWGAGWKPQMLLFLEIQAGVALVLAVAVMAAANNPAPLGLGDAVGVLIALVAIAGESMADGQLSRFARNPANSGKVCDSGLWAWSRHPNYFFEFLYWVALVPIGIGHAWGWVALAAPLMMFVLLRYVSGVPPLEQHMLRSRGPAFAAYQQRVPAFFPRPPRR
jgi:steroid 5-alpha reductase family enzyme